jgi:thiamine-monophosphate kinase
MTEFEIIERLRKIFPVIGDDAAEVSGNGNGSGRMIVSTDSFVEGEHFGDYFTPYDMGYKSVAASVSDIAACGGVPTCVLVSVGLKNGDRAFVEGLYKGVKRVADMYGFEVVGGDTTRSRVLFVSVTVLGKADRFVGRGGAKRGDRICVTGDLGGSRAGLIAFQNGTDSILTERHLHPSPRMKDGEKLGNYATSMIDISDGFVSDLSHILRESKVGARIWRDKLPISEETQRIAREFSLSAQELAMNGGEDFELLFTVPTDRIDEVGKTVEFTEVGEIISEQETKDERREAKGKISNRIVDEEGNAVPIKGFDHFERRISED